MSNFQEFITGSAEESFKLGERVGQDLKGGEIVLLTGSLGAGKTVITKGITAALGYEPDDVTSPSFTLVNLYRARLDVYHIDLWRVDEKADAAVAVGLDDILADEKAVVIVEWAEKLGREDFAADVIRINISGDGDEPRKVAISTTEHFSAPGVK